MRVLITGITGFVGARLEEHLKEQGAEVFGTSRKVSRRRNVFKLNLMSKQDTTRLLKQISPTHVFHLAGISNVRQSWNKKAETIGANTMGTIHLLEAVKSVNPEARVVTIGSSEEYGCANDDKVPETAPLNPLNPYGVSKAAV
ncbi:MAG TPA: NAD-dependent epimerase/dehydratase family protein, partial [Bacillales bacterium]|nr:NAD-dependent epimerase/dehydratase family protein [Bacillales bacterium]